MILKVTPVQPICDQHKRDFYKSKDGLNKNKAALFSCILENAIREHTGGKQIVC